MTKAASACQNPLCSCDACSCSECTCGATRFGTLEERVMDWLWAAPLPAITVRDLADALPEYAYTTLATVLDRLVQKGMVRSELDGRTKRYTTVGSRGRHTAVLMYDALTADADPTVALQRFVESLDDSQAAILRQALQGSERRRRRPPG